MVDLYVKIGEVALKNPILVASGCFGVGREYGEVFDTSLLGGIVAKTITLEPREGNPPPRVCETPAGMLNSIGLANPGIKAFIEEDFSFFSAHDCARIISIAGERTAQFVEIAERLSDYDGFDAFELNVSCPNVRAGIAFGVKPKLLSQLVSAVRVATKKPIWVKLTPNTGDIVAAGKAARDAGADALCAINTITGLEIDIEARMPRLGNIIGGLSGPAIRPIALAKVFQLHRDLPDIPIIGVGGIGDPEDVVAHLLAGASAVQIGSGQFRSPTLPLEAIAWLSDYCEQQGFTRVMDLTGSLIL